MTKKAVPMIHVPDVAATVDWYTSIGFTSIAEYGNDGDGLSFAMMAFGSSEVMFSQGGHPSSARRRELDLYIYTDNVDSLYLDLKDRVEVVEGLHDTFYGMREFIVRDLNRFWITFGQESAFSRLMNGVREGSVESVRVALEGAAQQGGMKPDTLSAALAATLAGDEPNADIVEILTKAGAQAPPEVAHELLQSYAGKYTGGPGAELNVTLEDGKLVAAMGRQAPLALMAVDQITFKPIYLDDMGTLSFEVAAGKTIACSIQHSGHTMRLTRAGETEEA
jgi:hypothetical protein